jgi:hypothetical protein
MQDSDQASVDRLIADFFEAFDNRGGRVPDRDSLADMFAGQAVVAMHRGGDCVLCTPAEFIEPRMALLTNGELVGFHEWEESATTQLMGSLALRSSRYAKSGFRDGTAVAGTGTKFFQLARLPSGWRIVALSWIDDA